MSVCTLSGIAAFRLDKMPDVIWWPGGPTERRRADFLPVFFSKRFKLFCRQNTRRQRVTNRIKSFRHHSHSSRHKLGCLTWGQCYKTNASVIYCQFRLNYHRNIYNIEFTLEYYCSVTVNYRGILTLEIIGFSYRGNLPWKITAIVL